MFFNKAEHTAQWWTRMTLTLVWTGISDIILCLWTWSGISSKHVLNVIEMSCLIELLSTRPTRVIESRGVDSPRLLSCILIPRRVNAINIFPIQYSHNCFTGQHNAKCQRKCQELEGHHPLFMEIKTTESSGGKSSLSLPWEALFIVTLRAIQGLGMPHQRTTSNEGWQWRQLTSPMSGQRSCTLSHSKGYSQRPAGTHRVKVHNFSY